MSVVASVGTELFVPELVLGADRLEPADAAAIGEFITAVAEARGFPLHLAVAWNALNFGYDLAARSYPAEVLEAFMPTIALAGAANAAVPVGALAWVQVGGAEGDVWAEVVAKDGRPVGGDEMVVDPAVAGALAPTVVDDGFEVAVVSEALVVDFEAFGPIADGLGRRLERLRRRGRLDRHGLILTDSRYLPPEAASDEDVWFYARWLVDHQPHLLRSGPVGAAVGRDTGLDTLAAAVLASFEAVSAAITAAPGLRRWGDFVLPAAWVGEVDDEANLPLGAADLAHLLNGIARSGDEVPAAATLLGRLEPLVPATDPSRPDREVPDPLAGVGFVRQVVRANRWLADRVEDCGRIVSVGGRKVAVRIDDLFPYGGLWRAEPVVADHPLLDVPVDVPLALGGRGIDALADWLGISVEEVLARIAAAEAAAATSYDDTGPGREGEEDDQQPEEELEDPRPLEDLNATLLSATVTVRALDIDNATLRLPEGWGWLSGEVTVMLSHAGEIDDDQLTQPAGCAEEVVAPLSWPLDFFPGIRLHLSVFASGSTIFASTVPLVPPVDGYDFVFDPSVVGRPPAGGCRSHHGDGTAGDASGERAGGIPLVDVLVGLLARRGRRASDGTRRATARELAILCFGPERPSGAEEVLVAALEPAVASGRLVLAGSEYIYESWRAGRPGRAPGPSGWGRREHLARAAVAAHVPGFVRRLAPGFTASAEKRASYAQARAEGLILFGPEVLPDGHTWVRPHERGGASDAYAGALTGIVSTISGRSPEADDLAAMRAAWGLDGAGGRPGGSRIFDSSWGGDRPRAGEGR
ncbi:MAG TPA: hypothetical protein VFN73_03125 [Propionibacteriaceae bacterium]|nr:hypothetical protein [Propionibacteriaceae bacterium]